jgi:hypothetical protein
MAQSLLKYFISSPQFGVDEATLSLFYGLASEHCIYRSFSPLNLLEAN